MSERREVAPGVWIEAEKLPPEAMDRIEELIEVVKGIDETVGSFGYSLGLLNVEGSAGDLEDLEMVLDEAEKLADRARSLLVPKEEA